MSSVNIFENCNPQKQMIAGNSRCQKEPQKCYFEENVNINISARLLEVVAGTGLLALQL